MKSVKPWKSTETCPVAGYEEFKKDLMQASFHNAAEGSGEMRHARSCTRAAAEVAIEHEWPIWAITRMFKETEPLVAWDEFLQIYVDILYKGYKENMS